MSVNASPKRGLPGSRRVDDHADGLDHDLRVVDHDVVSRVRVGDVRRAGHERRELVLGRRVRSVDDRSDVPRRVRRQLTGLDELRDDIDELVAGREHDDRHGPRRCRGGRLVQGLIEILPFQIRIGRERLGRTGVDALPDLPLLRRHLGAKLGREDVNEHDTFDFVRMLAGKDPCDRAAERVRDEDVRARYVGRLQQGDEVVDALLGTGRLGHRVAPAKGLVEVERTGSVVGAHPRRLLDFVVDRRTLLISSVPQVGRRVRTRDEQDGGRSVAITLDVHHPASADVDPLGERLGVRPGRVGSPSASGQHTREGGDGDDEHGHKPATAADGGRAHCEGRCWTCSHDLLIAIVGG